MYFRRPRGSTLTLARPASSGRRALSPTTSSPLSEQSDQRAESPTLDRGNPINRYALGDRSHLAFDADGGLTLYVQSDSPGKDRESNWTPALPPDGRWLAYTLRTANSANVYVEPSPVTGAKYQVTTENGHHLVWLSDGKGLSYRVSGSQQVVVSVDTTPSFSIGNPGPAIAGGLPTVVSIGSRSYDITPDGTAFLTVSPLSGPQPGSVETQEIQIVQNWLEELKRLVPTR